MKSGAGGNWKTIEERTDSSVPRQTDPTACVAATGEMLLRAHGVEGVSQKSILAKIRTLADARNLAPLFNEIDMASTGSWFGFACDPTQAAFDELNTMGAWGTVFREGTPVGHFVMVEGVTQGGRVKIKDPYPRTPKAKSGSSYEMTIEEFMKVWSGEVVFNAGK